MSAIAWGHDDIACELINAGAEIDAVDAWGRTALIHAISNNYMVRYEENNDKLIKIFINHHDIILTLIECNANVNHIDGCKDTPLLYASERNDIEVVEKLIEKGANVNYIGDREYSPLMQAYSHGQWQVASVLVRAGADVNIAHYRQIYPLKPLGHALFAINPLDERYTDIIEFITELLKKGADISIIEKQKIAINTDLIPLIAAAEAADILSVDVNAKFADGIDDNNFSVFMDRYIYLLKGKYNNAEVIEQVQKLSSRVSTDEELKNSSIVNQIKEYCKNICEETIINHDPVSSFSPVSDQIDEIPASDINLKIIGDDSSPS